MRLQPPKNINDFHGKNFTNDLELINSYIGSHRLIYRDGEKTVKDWLDSKEWINQSHVNGFVSMFPMEIQDLAETYLNNYLEVERKNRTTDLSGKTG